MPSPPPTALALSQPRLSGWPAALLPPAREPKVFWDFWRSWVWPSGEEGREDTEVWGRGVAVFFSPPSLFLCLEWMRSLRWTDRRRLGDEDKQLSLMGSGVARPVPRRPNKFGCLGPIHFPLLASCIIGSAVMGRRVRGNCGRFPG